MIFRLPLPLSTPRRLDSRRLAWAYALALGCLLFGLYGLTGSRLRFGYEGENIVQAEAYLTGALHAHPGGGLDPAAKGGLLEVAAYLPFAAVKVTLEKMGMLVGLRQLVYVVAVPFYTVLLLLVFYGLCLELYSRPPTAAALTVIVGLATMIWPYAKFGMETQQTLWTLAGLWALARYANRRAAGATATGAAAAFGLALGALLLTKITGPLHAAALGLAGLWVFFAHGLWRGQPRRASLLHGLLAGSLALAGLILFLLTNHWRYGGWVFAGRYGLAELSPYPIGEGLYAVLASPGKSLFLYSPPLLIGLWYWGRFWRRFPALRMAIFLLALVGLWHLHLRPWADETWGPRRLHYLVPVLALPLGLWLAERHLFRRPIRYLGFAIIGLGLWVQLLAVAFDYTAYAFTMGKTDLFAQEQTVWDPQLSPVRFNLHLLAADWQRHRSGRALPFVYERHYLSWTAPAKTPPAQFYEVRGLDRLDLWYLQQRADWPGRPYWFVSPSSFFMPLMALLALAGGGWLVWQSRRSDLPDAKNSSVALVSPS